MTLSLTPASTIPAPGFADTVRDAQQTFRSILEAFSMPLRPVTIAPPVDPVGGLTVAAAAIALALCDENTPVWLDSELAADPSVTPWLTFHTASEIVTDPHSALFVFVSSPTNIPAGGTLAFGTDETPHLSATVVVSVDADDTGYAHELVGTGPGINGSVTWRAPALPAHFLPERAAAATQFPRGIDYLFATQTTVTGVPRTTRLTPTEGGSGISISEGSI